MAGFVIPLGSAGGSASGKLDSLDVVAQHLAVALGAALAEALAALSASRHCCGWWWWWLVGGVEVVPELEWWSW